MKQKTEKIEKKRLVTNIKKDVADTIRIQSALEEKTQAQIIEEAIKDKYTSNK